MAVPSPVLKWAKYVIRYGGEAAAWLLTDLDWTHDADPSTNYWRHLQVVWTRVAPTGVTEDRAVIDFDLVNLTGGAIDSSWTTGDYTAAETPLGTFLNTLKSYQDNQHTCVQYRWYKRAFNPLTNPKTFAESGPPERVTTVNYAGTGTQPMPYQVACTITEKTAWAKHWGRFYLPGLNGTMMAGGGRWSTAGAVDNVLAAADTLYEAWAAAELFAVVPVSQVNKAPYRALLGVRQLQVDDIPDIQRRRRPRQVKTRILSTP